MGGRTLGIPLRRGSHDSDRRFFAEANGGGFSPEDLANLQLWLKADAITGLTDGQTLPIWQDSSTEDHDFTQQDGGVSTYETSVLNGLPVVRVPAEAGAADDFLDAEAFQTSGTGWGTAQTWFFVVRSLAAADDVIRVGFEYANSTDGTIGLGLYLDTDVAPGWYFASSGTAAEPFTYTRALTGTITDWHILCVRVVPAARARLFIDGGNPVVMPLDAAYANAVRTTFPGPWTTTAEQLNMEYAEVISYRDALTSADLNTEGAYLAAKYGLTWTAVTAEPADLTTPAPAFWLAADDIEGFADDAVLPYWTDSSSHYRDAVTDVGSEPTYKTNILNGNPVVRFASDGSGYVYSEGWTTPGASTLFLVAKTGDGSFGSVEDWADGRPALILQDGVGQVQLAGTSTITAPETTFDTTWHIVAGVANGASSAIYVDGASVATGNIGATAIGGGIGLFGTGDTAEAIVFQGALSTADLNLVGNYLADKYALTWTDI